MRAARPSLYRLGLAVVLLGLMPAPFAYAQPEVVRIPIQGTIDKGLGPFVKRSLEAAAEAGAPFAVLDINTPGGRVDAAWQIVDALQEAQVPAYAFVDRALSAGAMIALAADGIYVRPGATIGAATPVTGEGQKASEKMVSAMRSEFRALAEARGLDPRIAEAMVDEEIEIEGLVEAGKLLTLSADEAIAVGVAQGKYDSLGELVAGLEAPGTGVRTLSPNWAELIVRFLTHPVVAPLLLTLGFLGLLFEVKTPGFGFGGLAGPDRSGALLWRAPAGGARRLGGAHAHRGRARAHRARGVRDSGFRDRRRAGHPGGGRRCHTLDAGTVSDGG